MTFSTNNGFILNITGGTINIVSVCVKPSCEGLLKVERREFNLGVQGSGVQVFRCLGVEMFRFRCLGV